MPLLILISLLIGTGHGDDYVLIFDKPTSQPREDEKIISKNFIRFLEEFVQSDNGSPTYDACVFPNNIGEEQLQLLLIKTNSCEILKLNTIE